MVWGHFAAPALNYCFTSYNTRVFTVIDENGTHMYHLSIKRQVMRLSNDMNNIRMD